ncbi:RNA polymerase sigma-70 factor [candidate division KSB1 bacterium]|nr:RNA polymerase sigma-70 factor [candidate division KSB1 bacterium]
MPENEIALLQQLKHADRDSFQTLYLHYQPILFRHVYYRVKNYASAQDIVQETFIRVWQQRESIKPEKSFYAYILTISENLIRDQAKHRTVREKYKYVILPVAESLGDHPERTFDYQQLAETINRVVNKHLPEKCRTIFILSRINGHSTKTIANILHISPKTVENQLTRALAILRKKISSDL